MPDSSRIIVIQELDLIHFGGLLLLMQRGIVVPKSSTLQNQNRSQDIPLRGPRSIFNEPRLLQKKRKRDQGIVECSLQIVLGLLLAKMKNALAHHFLMVGDNSVHRPPKNRMLPPLTRISRFCAHLVRESRICAHSLKFC